MKISICLVILIFLIPALKIQAQEATPDATPNLVEYIVTTETANLRSAPNTTSEIVAQVLAGDVLTIYDEESTVEGWLRVYRPNDLDAYVADFLVERAPVRFYPLAQEPLFEIAGTGTDISEILDIPSGAYRIDATVQDRSFILSVIVVEGECSDDNIFNELDFDSTSLNVSALLVSTGCSVVFETDNVDGAWSFEVRDLLDEDFFLDSILMVENGTTISGRGHSLTMPTFLADGVYTITATVQDSAFILRPQVLEGECEGQSVFNEFNSDVEVLEVSSVYRSEEGGCFIFWDVSNVEGEWEITFETLN